MIILESLGIIGVAAGSALFWKRARALALTVMVLVGLTLIWHWTHRQMFDDLSWIFN